MGAIKTLGAIVTVSALCMGGIAILLAVAGVFESAVIEPVQAHMPNTLAETRVAAVPAILPPTAVNPASDAHGEIIGQAEHIDDTQMFIAGVILVLIIVVVIFAGPLQAAVRR